MTWQHVLARDRGTPQSRALGQHSTPSNYVQLSCNLYRLVFKYGRDPRRQIPMVEVTQAYRVFTDLEDLVKSSSKDIELTIFTFYDITV